MKTAVLALVFVAIGVAAIVGGVTGSPLLVAMVGGLRGRAPNTALTRAGMVVGGVLAVILGVLTAMGYVGFAEAP